MTKFFKENKKMLLLFLAIAIIFPFIILFPSSIGIIPYETGLTIVGYGGSILGGFFTLFGVWWTIEDNKRQREEEIKPILVLRGHHREIYVCQSLLKIRLRLENAGTYEAKNIKISISDISNDKTFIQDIRYTEQYSLIAKDTDVSGSISFVINSTDDFPMIKLQIKITYYGLKDKKYETSCKVFLKKGIQVPFNDGWVFSINDFNYIESEE